jgi:hypothetical protein
MPQSVAQPPQPVIESSSPHSSQSLHFAPMQSLSSTASSSAESPLPAEFSASPSPPLAPPTSSHPMVTRARNNISKPREFIDGRVQYPLLRALLAESLTIEIEPTCHSITVKDKIGG